MSGFAIEAKGISKRFPGVVALDNVSIGVKSGSVHALMGENGAGKSTLGKIFCGIYGPDAGEVILEGKAVHFRGPDEAFRAGIGMVHQELLFCENLSVAENLCLSELPRKGVFIDRATLLSRSKEALSAIGAEIDPDIVLGDLPVSKQQLVQIAAAVGRGARILIFDEPTSSLSRAETESLFELIKRLQAEGVTSIYVSHRMEEVFAICDTVSVLMDGKHVATEPIENLDHDILVRLMIGRDIDAVQTTTNTLKELPPILEVRELSCPGKFSNISLTVSPGEVLGIAGLVGAGRTELLEALFGLTDSVIGEVAIEGKRFDPKNPVAAMRAGLGLIPEDRKRHGLVLSMDAKSNISLPTLSELAAAGWINREREGVLAQSFFDRLRVRAPSIEAGALSLSGGNQQKLVIAKWLAADCKLLMVDEPTRGVDVGAKAEIHGLLRGLAQEGKGILMVSSDLPELLGLATRIIVLRDGRIVGELSQEQFSEEAVMRLMAGMAA